jgi:hypothetical protein
LTQTKTETLVVLVAVLLVAALVLVNPVALAHLVKVTLGARVQMVSKWRLEAEALERRVKMLAMLVAHLALEVMVFPLLSVVLL